MNSLAQVMDILRGKNFVVDEEIACACLREARQYKPAVLSAAAWSANISAVRPHQAASAMIVGSREC